MRNRDLYREFTCLFLDCGLWDLEVLDKADPNFIDDIIHGLEYDEEKISLESIINGMFNTAREDIESAVYCRIQELKEDENDNEIDELNELEQLDPYEDIDWTCNSNKYIDSSIYITNGKYSVYKKYFGNLIKELENKMGFKFGD